MNQAPTMVPPCPSNLASASCRKLAGECVQPDQQLPCNPAQELLVQFDSPVCGPRSAAQRNMPIDHSSRAFAGNSAGASMLCEVVSYEGSQILFPWAIRIRLEEVVNGCLQPDWFSCTSRSVIASRRGCFT